jgi:hypothetical protein
MIRIVAAFLVSIGFCSAVSAQTLPNDSIKAYVEFLNSNALLSPKEYVLKSLDEYVLHMAKL